MKAKRLTLGMRAKFVPHPDGNTSWDEYTGQECLLKERSTTGGFAVMVLGQSELKREDPKTVENEVAWVDEEELEFVNADFDTNLEFIDWYQENEDNFCADCGAWFPENDGWGEEAGAEPTCPNEKCPGRLYDQGLCPHCEVPAVNDECPKCQFEFEM